MNTPITKSIHIQLPGVLPAGQYDNLGLNGQLPGVIGLALRVYVGYPIC